MMNIRVCDLGCGRQGVFISKKGRACCAKSVRSCPNFKHPMIGKKSWNSGLTKEIDNRIEKGAKTLKINNAVRPKRAMPQSQRDEISKKLKGKMPKFVPQNGKGKKGKYLGIHCDSSWELAFVIYHIDHNIGFRRNNQKFTYRFKDVDREYTPDFIFDDGTFVEIKGNFDEKSRAKIDQFPLNIILLRKKEMEPIFNYIKSKYGKNFVTLYDNHTQFENDVKVKVKRKPRTQYLEHRKKKAIENVEKMKKEILESKINYDIQGWECKISKIIKMSEKSVQKWMRKHMKDIYNYAILKNKHRRNKTKSKKNESYKRALEKIKKDDDLKSLVMNCGIDFSKKTWKIELKKIWPVKGKPGIWIRNHMYDFYVNCFQHKPNQVPRNKKYYKEVLEKINSNLATVA